MHSQIYGRVNSRVHKKVLVLFQESCNATTTFLQLRHFLLDVFQEVRVGSIKSKLPYMAPTYCCDLLSQLQAKGGASAFSKKKSIGFCSFPLRLIISRFFVE